MTKDNGSVDRARWMEEMARIVGQYEDEDGIPFGQRITWPYYSLGLYVFKPGVRPEQAADAIKQHHSNVERGSEKEDSRW